MDRFRLERKEMRAELEQLQGELDQATEWLNQRDMDVATMSKELMDLKTSHLHDDKELQALRHQLAVLTSHLPDN